MLIDLTYDVVKFIVTQSKNNPNNINFTKLNIGEHKSFNDNFWNYWIYETYAEMCQAYPDYVSMEFPCDSHMIPPEEYM